MSMLLRSSLFMTSMLAAAGTAAADPAPTVKLPAAETPPLSGRAIDIGEAVQMALASNPSVASADLDVEAAKYDLASTRGHYGPRLHAEGSAYLWDSPFSLSLSPTEAFVVRENHTENLQVDLIEPLSPLLVIAQQVKAQRFDVDLAKIHTEVARSQLAYKTVEAFYRVLEANELAGVADKSVAQLQAHASQARTQLEQGVIAKNDVLRAELAVKNAQQRQLETRSNLRIALGQLAVIVGLPQTTAIAPTKPVGATPAHDSGDLGSAVNSGIARRPELRELHARYGAAQAQASIATLKLLPTINLDGNVAIQDGVPFNDNRSAAIGLTLSWDIWDWGSTYNAHRSADAHARQAKLAIAGLEDQVRVEVQRGFEGATTAADAFDLANDSLVEAEDNFRIETSRYENSATTSVELLDAEQIVTAARAQVERARYDALIASAALRLAAGAPPNEIAAGASTK